MKLIIALLLISLSACSTKTITKIKDLTIPAKYLKCEKLPEAEISEEARWNASGGDFKLFTIEMVEDRVSVVEPLHKKCVGNAKDAREYQERMSHD